MFIIFIFKYNFLLKNIKPAPSKEKDLSKQLKQQQNIEKKLKLMHNNNDEIELSFNV